MTWPRANDRFLLLLFFMIFLLLHYQPSGAQLKSAAALNRLAKSGKTINTRGLLSEDLAQAKLSMQCNRTSRGAPMVLASLTPIQRA